ncbi:S41 family peptidase [Bacteroidota bacterium]
MFNSIKKITPNKFSKIIFLFFIISFISLSFNSLKDKDFELSKNLDIYQTLLRELNIYYVDEIEPGELIKKSINVMLQSLDPYTAHISESMIEDFRTTFTGEYSGIGALIRGIGGKVIVAEPYENSPAIKAGLKAGDIFLEVDGISVKGKSSTEVSELLKSQTKTIIKVLVERPGEEENIKFEFERDIVRIDNVPYYGMLENKTAYIRATGFTNNAGNEVRNAIKSLKNDYDVKGIILDLRANPGGLLIEAVNMANIFIDEGVEIVSTRGKAKHWDKTYFTRQKSDDLEIPVAVLVNSQSASASEIVAGSLQDLDRAVIIGQKSFGKGLVQTTRKLAYNNQLKLTTAKYYIPSGRCIQALDYSNRNEDGSVGKIADSLITKFKTKNGRVVQDGGGILPDIVLEQRTLSKISASLLMKNIIFDFATQYAIDHKSIGPAKEFSINDNDYDQFVKFLEGKDYKYNSESETSVNTLIEIAKREEFYESIEDEIKSIKDKLLDNPENEIYKFKDEISEIITAEIVSRYYNRKGKIESLLRNDHEVKKAVEILADREEYEKILSGK